MPESSPSPNYGIDAPGVVRNLFLAASAGLLLFGLNPFGIRNRALPLGPIGGVRLLFPLGPIALCTGLGCAGMAVYMLWTSRYGKLLGREALLDHVPWTGHERVLDVGCGRGLMLVGAARRLQDGLAVGIDIWQAEDLSGNRAGATLENARIEGVADRVQIQTADMRHLPFQDASFDVVVSSAAIHNLYARDARQAAVREIARVLKPGGRAVIDDIRHTGEYAATFAAAQCPNVRQVSSSLSMVFLALLTWGSLRPATLLAQKTSAPTR
jgi:arsenite methyltransferase